MGALVIASAIVDARIAAPVTASDNERDFIRWAVWIINDLPMSTLQSFIRPLLAAGLLLGCDALVRAQEPGSRAGEQAREQEKKAQALSTHKPGFFERELLAMEEAGGFGVARGLFVAAGDIKRGSGLSLGPAYGKTFANDAVFVAKGVYSVTNAKLAQLSLQMPPLANRRLIVSTRARWQDVPEVLFFGLAPGDVDASTHYSETMTELSAASTFRPVRLLRFGAGLGFERFETDISHGADPARNYLFTGAPGVGADPRYLHAYGSAAIDGRDGPGYSRHGSLLRATLHEYRQQNDGPYSFRRADGVAEQYLPILHGSSVIYLGVHASTTSSASGQTVPFFLMPDLGGHNLRGFRNYRFRDRHSLLFTAEYRWYAQEYLDGAIFYDAGKAVPDRSLLDFTQLKSSYGAGIRLHGPRTTVLRLEVARSRERLRLIVAFSPVGG